MSLTIWGCLARLGGIGDARDSSGTLIRAHALDELSLELPDHGLPLSVEHDDDVVIGEAVHVEIGDDDRVLVVAVVDDAAGEAVVAQHEDDLFLSGDYLVRSPHVHERAFVTNAAWLCGCSLVSEPGNLAASPIRMMQGDVRRRPDRSCWPMSWTHDYPVLARSIETRSASTRIVDRRNEYGPPEPRYARPVGRLWHGPPGTILSIR